MNDIIETLLKDLNPAQKQAVESTEGPLLILAGAGSGKTRVITYRIAYLLSLGIDPSRILAVTFTNKAAEEMSKRVKRLVEETPALQIRSSDGLWIGTFHSTCVKILRRQIERLGYRNDFMIYDNQDQMHVVKECLKKLNMSDKEFRPQFILGHISGAKNQLLDSKAYQQSIGSFFEQKVSEVYTLYQKLLKSNNALDFDDLILNTVVLFSQHPEVLKLYQDRFQYIMIDEYQDTNHAQYRLINLLAAVHQNICVVGDPDQAIYRWRGADFKNLLNFEDDYSNCTEVVLDENYRSTQNILNASNHLIRFNRQRKEKNLWTQQAPGALISYFNGSNEHEEVDFVINSIERLKRQGEFSYQDMVVFYRTHAQSRVFEDGLRRSGIPYQIVGGLSFYQRKEIKDMVAYLRLIEGFGDSVSFKRVVNVPPRGIGEATIEKLEKWRSEMGVSLLEAALRSREVESLSSKTRQTLESFAQLINKFKELKETLSPPALMTQWVEEIHYFEEAQKSDPLTAEGRIDNIKEFVSFAQEYVLDFESPTLGGFLEGISLVSNMDQWADEGEKLTLMTLHSAKGLEFSIAFIVGLEEGIFPHASSGFDEDELEEERRLLYVGMTRAKNRLSLSSVNSRMIYGRRAASNPSRFLSELPSELIERVSLYAHDFMAHEASSVGIPSKKEFEYIAGKKVLHAVFGIGEVLETEGEGDDVKVRVAFDKNSSSKWLMAKYARLTPL
ncbi:MAG: UvrD-helicase domain-containing protein [Chlamydiae bacterium]|nr:UvrD-helicase domain-containing protein [Chlamydiota bacterium]MBI3276294.1 UvrD-helicase domain-containing protein [Chlamydiota bacterium]